MAKKTTQQLLSDLASETNEARADMGSAKHHLVRAGEMSNNSIDDEDEDEFLDDEDEEEQDLDSDEESDDELDEESDEEDEEDEDEEDEDEEDEEDDHSNSKNSTAAQRRINAKKDKQIEELTSMVESLKLSGSKKEQEDILSEMAPLAEELGLDPAGLGKIAEKMIALAEKRLASKLPSDEEIARQREHTNKVADEQFFNSEWKEFAPSFLKQHPNATARQLEQAKLKMDEIAHDPELGGRKYKGTDGKERLLGYPLNVLAIQNKKDFDSIFSKKRFGLEGSHSSDNFEAEETMDTSTAKGIDALDRMYNKATTESSGLRRGRRPRSRTI